ncbi:MAG: amidohydrolase [Lachnospiraceae bacterium]|nr:amidohydrolase [Lachnospiraceae bacterium]
MKLSIKEEAHAYSSELIALRREFHEYPELGFREYKTSKTIYDYLKALKADSVRNVSKTGVVGQLKGHKGYGKTVMLRVPMDGMPILEQTGLSFQSKNTGVMHAGGKDAQMAVALVVTKMLKRHRDEFAGTFEVLFQPNEEFGGAADMIADHVLEDPVPDHALAMHFTSMLDVGDIGLSSGVVLANVEQFTVKVSGDAGTTYMPHKSQDTILGAARIVDAMQLMETRFLDPFTRVSVMFGRINGGTAGNITAGEVVMEGTIRYLGRNQKDMAQLIEQRFRQIINEVCSTMGLRSEVQFVRWIGSMRNDPLTTERLYQCARLTGWTAEHVVEHRSLMAEDFSEFAERVPSVLTFFGINNPDKGCVFPNNHARYNLDEDVMVDAAEYFFRSVLELLNEEPLYS